MKIAVVSSDSGVRQQISDEAAKLDCTCEFPPTLEEAVARSDLVFFEWPLQSLNTIEIIATLRKARDKRPPSAVVLLVPGHSVTVLERAQQFGAYDSLFSPPQTLEVRSEILAVRDRLGQSRLSEQLRTLLETELIGNCELFQKTVAEIATAARSSGIVLLLGETGTGKEVFAKAIHRLSARSASQYMAVNCAGLAENLMESELFGHKKGAFTGAERDREGRFEAVGTGTLLLDEIGDIPAALQTKLLRTLGENTFERIGENHSREFRGRIIAATSVDLDQAVRENKFRPDLLGRIDQIRIQLPPLRGRSADIPQLVSHFLRKHARSRTVQISPTALGILQGYHFPRNVRQLEHAIASALARCGSGEMILPVHLPEEVRQREAGSRAGRISYADAREKSLRKVDREYLTEALERHKGNQSAVAEELGIDRKTLAARWKAVQEESGG
jgi:DNA-binding NtrC family response regulator